MGTKTELLDIFAKLSNDEREQVLHFMRKISKSKKPNINCELKTLSENEAKHLEDEFDDYKELYPKNE